MTITPKPPAPHNWMGQAACAGFELNVFFMNDDDKEAGPAVQALCDHCPVQEDCLEWALKHKVTHGVWGGRTPRQRRRLLVKKTRVHCPGCTSTLVQMTARTEICLSCGLTWLA